MPRPRLRWWLVAAFLLVLDVAAIKETWNLATEPMFSPGSGPVTSFSRMSHFADGRIYAEVLNSQASILISRQQVRSWNWEGQLATWWPVLAASIFTLALIWFVRRQAWRALWQIAGARRWTIQRLMIAVAIVAVECGLFLAWARSDHLEPESAYWGGTLVYVLFSNVLALLPIGILASYRAGDGAGKSIKVASNREEFAN